MLGVRPSWPTRCGCGGRRPPQLPRGQCEPELRIQRDTAVWHDAPAWPGGHEARPYGSGGVRSGVGLLSVCRRRHAAWRATLVVARRGIATHGIAGKGRGWDFQGNANLNHQSSGTQRPGTMRPGGRAGTRPAPADMVASGRVSASRRCVAVAMRRHGYECVGLAVLASQSDAASKSSLFYRRPPTR